MKIKRKTDKQLINLMESSKLLGFMSAALIIFFLMSIIYLTNIDKINEHNVIFAFVGILFLFIIFINIFDSIERTQIILEISELKK